MPLPEARQADIDALVELVTDQLNQWRDSSHGDREGAVELLLRLLVSDNLIQITPYLGQAPDYLNARLSDLR